MPKNQEIVMETTHGRKPKCKTEFKAVINKVLVSGLILTTLMSSTIMPAYAATNIRDSVRDTTRMAQTYGVNVEDSIYEIRATIDSINQMRANGTVSDAMIKKLANQILALGQAVNYSSEVDLNEVSYILDDASRAVSGLNNASDVEVAVAVIRTTLGINNNMEDSYTTNQAEAAPMVSSFKDVNKGDWYYDSVTKMTQMGYFAGKGEIVGGVGTFAPNDTMTKAEFLTVVARILYDEDNLKAEDGAEWWAVYYRALVDNGVITVEEYKPEEMGKPMTRQEMAQIAVRVMRARGETLNTLYEANVKAAIPDINDVGTGYTQDVLRAYSEGIIAGMDSKGTFKPHESLNRASATMVLYRIVEPSVREKKDFSKPNSSQSIPGVQENTQAITIHEGQESVRRFAKEGDIVIKADGTQVVLKKGPHGIVGEGQGVAPDLGVKLSENAMYSEVVRAKNSEGGMNFTGATSYKDGSGTPVMNNSYYVNEITGEGHWESEWQAMSSKPTTNGSFNYQLSSDKNWMWLDSQNDWCALYIQDIADSGIPVILQANGL